MKTAIVIDVRLEDFVETVWCGSWQSGKHNIAEIITKYITCICCICNFYKSYISVQWNLLSEAIDDWYLLTHVLILLRGMFLSFSLLQAIAFVDEH